MTSMKNKVQLMGRLGQDPELKTVGNGQTMLRLRMATNERFKSTQGEWKEDTQWHTMVAWGKLAERMAALVRKGSGLAVEGRLVHSSYEGKDGTKRYSTDVVLSDFQLMAARADQPQAEED